MVATELKYHLWFESQSGKNNLAMMKKPSNEFQLKIRIGRLLTVSGLGHNKYIAIRHI